MIVTCSRQVIIRKAAAVDYLNITLALNLRDYDKQKKFSLRTPGNMAEI
jgi:hypothetical protein